MKKMPNVLNQPYQQLRRRLQQLLLRQHQLRQQQLRQPRVERQSSANFVKLLIQVNLDLADCQNPDLLSTKKISNESSDFSLHIWSKCLLFSANKYLVPTMYN